MRDPRDRDRQQRELTAEMQHDAEVRAARKRLEAEHTMSEDQRQPPGDQPLARDEIRDWAADGAQQTNGATVAPPTPRSR